MAVGRAFGQWGALSGTRWQTLQSHDVDVNHTDRHAFHIPHPTPAPRPTLVGFVGAQQHQGKAPFPSPSSSSLSSLPVLLSPSPSPVCFFSCASLFFRCATTSDHHDGRHLGEEKLANKTNSRPLPRQGSSCSPNTISPRHNKTPQQNKHAFAGLTKSSGITDTGGPHPCTHLTQPNQRPAAQPAP